VNVRFVCTLAAGIAAASPVRVDPVASASFDGSIELWVLGPLVDDPWPPHYESQH